jgi:Uma2 family endonuclease
MTPATLAPEEIGVALPTHLELPCTDGSILTSTQEHPQSDLLTQSLTPRLEEIHPDRQYCIGCDVGIYFKAVNPPLDGCKAPDWFYVPGVPPMLDGHYRRSYVLYYEVIRPLLIIEYASEDGSKERDETPQTGKFWVYEQAIAAPYYVIYEPLKGSVEVHRLVAGRYQALKANAAGRFPIEPLRIELGIWQGTFGNMTLGWLRAWDSATGELLPTASERAAAEKERATAAEAGLEETRELLTEQIAETEVERKRADAERKQAEVERKQKALFAEKLRSLGINPDELLPS